jgi:hypothetical protein
MFTNFTVSSTVHKFTGASTQLVSLALLLRIAMLNDSLDWVLANFLVILLIFPVLC